MAIDPNSISLNESQRQLLAELSDQAGKSWLDVLNEALSLYRPQPQKKGLDESFSAAAAQLGMVGCVEGPPDLSVNPAYMEGFGTGES